MLSDNLTQIEYEIKFHVSQAGRSIWEIGRRLNHVKKNDLAHGQFEKWLKNIKVEPSSARKMMKIADELLSSRSTLNDLGTEALYLIATLPEEQKQEQIERIENGDNPTVRELQEVKRKLKLSEADKKRLYEEKEKLAEQILNQKPIEKEVVVEKIPDDYQETKKQNKELTTNIEILERSLRIKKHELKELEENSYEAIALKDAIETLRSDKMKLETSMTNLMKLTDLTVEFENFFDTKMAPMRFKTLIQGLGTDIQIDKIREILTLVDSWLTEMNGIVPERGRVVIEGEIING